MIALNYLVEGDRGAEVRENRRRERAGEGGRGRERAEEGGRREAGEGGRTGGGRTGGGRTGGGKRDLYEGEEWKQK